ncbi:hypothetical protein NDU88_008744 [Pleurodeles waltl]|uniref:Uncharacterized protein n=1 Tax=Pleurodeles waltl TaxID=8319 RepID=A0AAV7PSH1_PLEWA|nr:hypothetical protein NDU88_008744 [Pleurodeles waltl]
MRGFCYGRRVGRAGYHGNADSVKCPRGTSQSSSPTESKQFWVSEEVLAGPQLKKRVKGEEGWLAEREQEESETGGKHNERKTEDDSTLTDSKKSEKSPEEQQGAHRSSQVDPETTDSDQEEEIEKKNGGP